jgi:hypothetical protein
MIFRAKQFNLLASDRTTVCGMGVEWTEPRTFVEWVTGAVMKLFVIAALLGVYAAVMLPKKPPHQDIWASVLAVSILCCLLAFVFARAKRRMPGKTRWMEFHYDGRMTASWDRRVWNLRVADIKSVEAEQIVRNTTGDLREYTHCVRIVTRYGKILRIASILSADDATELAVLMGDAVERARYPEHAGIPDDLTVPVW